MNNYKNNKNYMSRKDLKKQEKKNKALEKAYKEIAKNEYDKKIVDINNKIKDLKGSLKIELDSKNEELSLLKNRNIDNLSDKKNYLDRKNILEIEISDITNKINNIESTDEYILLSKSLTETKVTYNDKINNFKISNNGRIISVNERAERFLSYDIINKVVDNNSNNESADTEDISNEELVDNYIENDLIFMNKEGLINDSDAREEEKLSRGEIRKNKKRERKIAKERKRAERKSKKEQLDEENKNDSIVSENTSSAEYYFNEPKNNGVIVKDDSIDSALENDRVRVSSNIEIGVENENKSEGIQEDNNSHYEDKENFDKLKDLTVSSDQVSKDDLNINNEASNEEALIIDSDESKSKKVKKRGLLGKIKDKIVKNNNENNNKNNNENITLDLNSNIEKNKISGFKIEVTTSETDVTDYNYSISSDIITNKEIDDKSKEEEKDYIIKINPDQIMVDNVLEVAMDEKSKNKELKRIKREERKNRKNSKRLERETKRIEKLKIKDQKRAERDQIRIEKLAAKESKEDNNELREQKELSDLGITNDKKEVANLKREEKLRKKLDKKEVRALKKLKRKESKNERLAEKNRLKSEKSRIKAEKKSNETSNNEVISNSNKLDEIVDATVDSNESIDFSSVYNNVDEGLVLPKDEEIISDSITDRNKEKEKRFFKKKDVAKKETEGVIENTEIFDKNENIVFVNEEVDLESKKILESKRIDEERESEQLQEKFRIKEEKKKRRDELKNAKLKVKLDKKRERALRKDQIKKERNDAKDRANQIKQQTKEKIEEEKRRVEAVGVDKEIKEEKTNFISGYLANRRKIKDEKIRIKNEIISSKQDRDISNAGDGSLTKAEKKELSKQLKQEKKRIKKAAKSAKYEEKKNKKELAAEVAKDKKLENKDKERIKAEKLDLKQSFKNTKIAEKARRKEAKALNKLEEKKLAELRKNEKKSIEKERKIEDAKLKKERQYKKELQNQQKYKAKQQRRLLKEETKINKRALKIEMPKVNIVNMDQEENLGGAYQWDAESGSFKSSNVASQIDLSLYDIPEQLPRR